METLTPRLRCDTVLLIGGLILIHRSVAVINVQITSLLGQIGVASTYIRLFTLGARWDVLTIVIAGAYQNQTSLAMGMIVGSMVVNILGLFPLSIGLEAADNITLFHGGMVAYTCILASILVPMFTIFTSFPGRDTGLLLLLSFPPTVYAVNLITTKANLPNPVLGLVAPKSTLEQMEQGVDRLKEKRQDENFELWQMQGRRTTSTNAFLFSLLHLLASIVSLSIGSYGIAIATSNIGATLTIPSSTMGVSMLALALVIPQAKQSIQKTQSKDVGLLVAQIVGGNIFMITVCVGFLYLFGDAQELALRDVGVLVSETIALYLCNFLLLIVQLAGGRRWMSWVLGGIYAAFLTLELTWLRGRIQAQERL